MSLPVIFRTEARKEFREAAAWYEKQRFNLGSEFIAEVERCVELAAKQPHTYGVVYKDIRRIITKRFPYNICFRAEASQITVWAVFHTKRDPSIWQKRE